MFTVSPGSRGYGSVVAARLDGRFLLTYADGKAGAITKARFTGDGIRCRSWRVTH